MSNKPLVSVITSVFNAENTIEKCILSVIAQSYINYEHIIIDGKSTDKTFQVIERYKDNIAVVVSEKDTGIYNAWNKGLKIAKGEWICFLGADDEFYPEAIEKMVSIQSISQMKLDYISGRTHLFKDGQLVKTTGKAYDWKTFRRYVSTGHNGALHNRQLYEQVGQYNETYRSAADYELLLRVGKELKAGYTDYVTTKMNLGGASNMSYKPILEAHRAILSHSDESRIKILINTIKALIIYSLKKIR
jgi:glycosyltransferase involved in cell wall biosynthesis